MNSKKRSRKKRKHALQIMLMLFSLFMLLVAISMIYNEFKPAEVKAVTMEAGSPMVDVREFLLRKDLTGEYVTDIDELSLNIPGTYEIKIMVRNHIVISNLNIVDTTPPKASPVSKTVLKGEEIKPEDLVTDIIDATRVKAYFKEVPDTTIPGEQAVTVVLEDTSRNTTECRSTINVLDVKSFVTMEAGSDMNIEIDDFVDNGASRARIITDLSVLDVSKPVRHEVLLEVNGKVLTAYIDVVDTTPPTAVTVDQETYLDKELEAIAFVKNIKDISTYRFYYKTKPDFSRPGDQQVTVVLEDSYGNKSEFNAKLTVIPDNEAPVFSGIKNITVYTGDAVSYKKGVKATDNRDGDVNFTVDSSAVNLNKPGVYNVYYSAVDAAGNRASATSTVTVLNLVITEDQLYELVDGILEDIIDDSMSKRDKAWEIYQWVKAHVAYTGDSDKSDWVKEAYRGIKNGVGDCFTYYAVSEALLTHAGIDNMRVTRVGGRTQHFWNLINCGDGWYHFDTCPNKDKLQTFMLTDKEVEAYTKKRGNNYYNFDKSLYPRTPEN